MNENDRRFFLRRFFSFNNSSTTSNTTVSNLNGSFEEEGAVGTATTTMGGATAAEVSGATANSTLIKSSSCSSPINLPPAIKVEHVDEDVLGRRKTTISPDESASMVGSDSQDHLNDSLDLSTPSSTAPLIQLTRMDAFDDSELTKSLLQQQNSIELKPFRKKEVLIVDSGTGKTRPQTMTMPLINVESAPVNYEATATTTVRRERELPFIESLPKFKAKVSLVNDDSKQAVNNDLLSANNQKVLASFQLASSLPVAQQFSFNLKYRNLGKSGLRVSQFGLGTWVTFGAQISDEVADEILTTAYLNGINLFETGEVYAGGKAELTLGRLLKKKNWKRSSYIVCTKIYSGGKSETEKGLSRKHIIEGVNASLKRLQLDYVDIVFANKPDSNMPMEEIVRAFTHLINTDKTFYWGTSRWNSMEIMEAYSVARQFNLIPPMCEQAEYNMFQREEVELSLPDVYARIGIGTMTWSPLACGLLTGKYEDGIPVNSRAALKGYGWLKDKIMSEEGAKKLNKIRELQVVADKLNCSMAQLAIAWCLKNESLHSVLLGASSVEQLIENIQSLLIVPKLTHSIMNEIDKILGNKPTISRHASRSENLQKV